MYKSIIPGVLLLFLCLFSHAQTDSAAMAGQIIALEQKLADALPVDSNTWKPYLDPNWHLVDEDGNSLSRKEFLAG